MICTMLRCVRTISFGIWCVERHICFRSSWLTKSSSSSTVVPLSSVMHAFHSAVSYLWSVVRVHRFPNLFSKVFSPSLLQFVCESFVSIFCKSYYSKRYKFLITALSLLLNGMLITMPVFCHCIKNHYSQ